MVCISKTSYSGDVTDTERTDEQQQGKIVLLSFFFCEKLSLAIVTIFIVIIPIIAVKLLYSMEEVTILIIFQPIWELIQIKCILSSQVRSKQQQLEDKLDSVLRSLESVVAKLT